MCFFLIKPMSVPERAWSCNHWTAKEFTLICSLKYLYNSKIIKYRQLSQELRFTWEHWCTNTNNGKSQQSILLSTSPGLGLLYMRTLSNRPINTVLHKIRRRKLKLTNQQLAKGSQLASAEYRCAMCITVKVNIGSYHLGNTDKSAFYQLFGGIRNTKEKLSFGSQYFSLTPLSLLHLV